ncbi:MAG: NDP-hexose 4-ketoreductase, partial [Actinomycetota bacterium]|nr:NDP-hexose 4-ketoreductase [Actinomycetota bacterium]
AKKGYDPVLGARPLRRTIQREIEDVLSEKILYGELKAGEFVLVDATGEEKDATFIFTGSRREETLPEIPDLPPVDIVGTLGSAGPQDSTGAASA